ncbi:hypothetical protein JCM8547_003423 [Rhodosporidiobolus lusitaniae]
MAQQGERGHDEAEAARQKIHSLRTSLTHLTAHISSLTSRLTLSQSTLAALRLSSDKAAAKYAEETSALRALCAVWEGRWREERRAREEAEEKSRAVGEKGEAGRRVLNGRRERRETEMRVLHEPAKRPSRRRSSTTSSSSAPLSSSPSTLRAPSRTSKSTSRNARTPRARTSKGALLAHLSRELEREKTEAVAALAEKEEEIVRLRADHASRRSEAQQLYASLDTLFSLGVPHLSTAQTVPLPRAEDDEAEQLRSSHHSLPLHPLAQHTSILSHPSLAAAALHSRSRSAAYQDISSISQLPPDVGETLRLEEEVRGLEREIARLGSTAVSDPPLGAQAVPQDASLLVEPDLSPTDCLALLSTISDLTAQLERLQKELREVKNERAALRGVCERYRRNSEETTSTQQPLGWKEREEELLARVEELEAECSRLSHLLHLSEHESAALASQLQSTHASIDALSDRVRRKLEEQKGKLERAREECRELREEGRAWRERCEALEAEMGMGMVIGEEREGGSGGSID